MLKNPQETKEQMITWIQHYFESMPKGTCVVIGISGGKDSSITAALCAEALGCDRVIGVLMPNGIQADIEYAHALVKYLGIKSIEINIAATVEALQHTIEQEMQSTLQTEVKVNLPARIRMTTLYAVAQNLLQGGRVVNTCNRSEDYVGYATKFGDAAGDFSVLSDLLVEEVRQVGYALGLPERFINKVPQDGLSGVSDEEKLGFTYQELDHYIKTGECEALSKKQKILQLHQDNRHKLEPMPSFKVTTA